MIQLIQSIHQTGIKFNNQLLLKFNDQKGNVYVGCILKSDKRVQLRLNRFCYENIKIRLNHQLIPNNGKPKQQLTYWHYLPLYLNKGDNFLLIKVHNESDKGWDMFASIEKESKWGCGDMNKRFLPPITKIFWKPLSLQIVYLAL